MMFSPQPCRMPLGSIRPSNVCWKDADHEASHYAGHSVCSFSSLPGSQPAANQKASPLVQEAGTFVCFCLQAGHNTIMMAGALRASQPTIGCHYWVQAGYSAPQNVVNSCSDNRDVMRCSLVDRHRRFGGTSCRQYQDLCLLLHATFPRSTDFPLC